MARVFNFSAGPCTLPEEVLKEAAEEMLDYKGSGMSVMEMSHRSKVYQSIIDQTEALLRENMGISDDYAVLFLQGGASTQFAMIPANLMAGSKKADYVNTGAWSKKAITEAKRYGEVNVLASSEDKTFSYIPEIPAGNPDADYYHITSNNTIYGTHFANLPDTGNVPLVADMSSDIMSEPINVSKYGLIYAGAQKNLGPAGVTLVIIRKDLIGKHIENTPTMLCYETHLKAASMFNTPPCYSIYMLGKVQEWVKKQGGVEGIYKNNVEKANVLYDYLDNNDVYKGTVTKKDRSLMNVTFIGPNDDFNAKFLKEAEAAGFVNLKGHRSVGGMRASIYNAMPKEGVAKLVQFMKDFAANNQ